MKILLQGIIFLVFIPHIVFAQQPLSREVLTRPIIEGQGVAGIRLGDTEVNVAEKMGGLPHNFVGFGKLQRTLVYGNMTETGGIFINIFMDGNTVIGIEVISVPTAQGHLYKGKTSKGFQLGDSLEKVKALYGEPYKAHANKDKFLWYKKDGLIFEYFSVETGAGAGPPQGIVIIKPDAEVPPHIKERGGPPGLWD